MEKRRQRSRLSLRRIFVLFWLGALGLLTYFLIIPESTRLIRASVVFLGCFIGIGLIFMLRHHQVFRLLFLGLLLAIASFLCWPSYSSRDVSRLRDEYVAALLRYEAVPYYWGGENMKGIDCSGLVRRALVDACWSCGIKSGDSELARQAISIWWHDTTAKSLGESFRGLTTPVLDVSSLREANHAQLALGDLAVSQNGVHVLAYIGNLKWIQADPTAGRVTITESSPSAHGWFTKPMKIVRWSMLEYK